MPKFDFNKGAFAALFSFKFTACFQNTFSKQHLRRAAPVTSEQQLCRLPFHAFGLFLSLLKSPEKSSSFLNVFRDIE